MVEYLWEKRWKWRGWRFSWTRRRDDEPLGLFGGGWDFKVGVQAVAGWGDVIVSLGRSELQATRERP